MISIRSHSRKWPWRDWQPLYCVGCEVLICLCRCVGLERGLLLDWYLGSQKLREILTLLYCFTLSSSREKPTQCSRGSKEDFWRRCRGDSRQVKSSQDVPSTHHKPYHSHYIICHSPLVFFSPTSPLPFYSPSFWFAVFLSDQFLSATLLHSHHDSREHQVVWFLKH